MEGANTYQQDTVKANEPLQIQPVRQDTGGLRMERAAPAPLEPAGVRDTEGQQADTTVQNQAQGPTPAQLRYRWWQREQQIEVDGSRYITPKTDFVVSGESTSQPGLVLPMHENYQPGTDWLTGLLLLSLAMLAAVRSSWSKYLGSLIQSVFNTSTALRMFGEKNYTSLHGANILNVYFYLVFSAFLFQLVRFFRFDFPYANFFLFLFCLGISIAFFLVKKLLYLLVGTITETTVETKEYFFNIDNVNRVAGLILFPVVALIAFYPFGNPTIPVYAGIMVVIFMYLKQLQRGIFILFRKQFSILYLFLYFCTLEFLPLVLLYKILVVQSGII